MSACLITSIAKGGYVSHAAFRYGREMDFTTLFYRTGTLEAPKAEGADSQSVTTGMK